MSWYKYTLHKTFKPCCIIAFFLLKDLLTNLDCSKNKLLCASDLKLVEYSHFDHCPSNIKYQSLLTLYYILPSLT